MSSLIYGIGINDSDYITSGCQYYRRWINMLQRCYLKEFQKRQPKYIGCTICNEWLTFSNFKKWMESQDWEGKELDKDVLLVGNKIYSPDTCCFVSKNVNNAITIKIRDTGLPIGVAYLEKSGKYRSVIMIDGERKHLGCYSNEHDASNAYVTAKCNYITKLSEEECEPIKSALLIHAEIILKSESKNVE